MQWLNPGSKFMQAVANFADAIWINLMTLILCLPFATIGAALSAAHDSSRRSAQGEAHITRAYWRAVWSNLYRATVLWVVYAASGVALLYAWVTLHITPLLIPKFGFTLLWLITFEWVFALQARFDNTPWRTLANACIFGVSHIGWTLCLLLIDAAYWGLLIACWFHFPQGLFLLVILGYGSMIYVHTPILERVFTPYAQAAVAHD